MCNVEFSSVFLLALIGRTCPTKTRSICVDAQNITGARCCWLTARALSLPASLLAHLHFPATSLPTHTPTHTPTVRATSTGDKTTEDQGIQVERGREMRGRSAGRQTDRRTAVTEDEEEEKGRRTHTSAVTLRIFILETPHPSDAKSTV
ncbi:hypothetical protein PAMP_018657 [Pampus punctatissimus]